MGPTFPFHVPTAFLLVKSQFITMSFYQWTEVENKGKIHVIQFYWLLARVKFCPQESLN